MAKMSSRVAELGRFTVLDTALSVWRWKCRLHTEMPLGRDVHRGHEHPAQIFGKLVEALDGPELRHAFQKRLAVAVDFAQGFLEMRVHFHKAFAVHDVAGEAQGEQRFHAGRAAARIDSVPVGAMVVMVALRRGGMPLVG